MQMLAADLTNSLYFHLLFHCHYFPYLVLVFVLKFNCSLGKSYFNLKMYVYFTQVEKAEE